MFVVVGYIFLYAVTFVFIWVTFTWNAAKKKFFFCILAHILAEDCDDGDVDVNADDAAVC